MLSPVRAIFLFSCLFSCEVLFARRVGHASGFHALDLVKDERGNYPRSEVATADEYRRPSDARTPLGAGAADGLGARALALDGVVPDEGARLLIGGFWLGQFHLGHRLFPAPFILAQRYIVFI